MSWCKKLSVLSEWEDRGTVLECHGVRNSLYYLTGKIVGTVLECHGVRDSQYYLTGKIEVQY